MGHLYKTVEWEGSSGRWYVADTAELGQAHYRWCAPARILGISLCDYVLLLKNKFKASQITFDNDVLVFSFNSQADARVYKNWINKEARNKNFIV